MRMLESIKRGNITWKKFGKDLWHEISEDNISNGAAALAYYLTLAVFPAMIALLTILPYLPIANLNQEIMNLLRQAMPGEAADMFTGVVTQVTSSPRGGLLSFGLLFTLWAASNGTYAIMQQLNITYDVTEGRPFWKTRGTALFLTLLFGALVITSIALTMFGDKIHAWLATQIGFESALLTLFTVARWSVIALAITLGFAIMYYWGPDVEQDFKFISPGSIFGTVTFVVASLLFKVYVTNFGKYSATYGSIGAVIVFMLWLYVTGVVMLLGSEVNALIEHYSDEGKDKGEKRLAA